MAGSNILSVDSLAVRDDSIIKKEIYPYAPYTTTFGVSDEIRIAIQSKDSYVLPSESYLYMKISATTAGVHAAGDPEVNFVSNFVSFLFSDVRYELNGVEIDCVRNVGRASTMKIRAASRVSPLNGYAHYCRVYEGEIPRSDIIATVKRYDVVIPLSVWFGFCDDYRKIILNCKHELILNRARQSLDCTTGGGALATASTVTIALEKIEWKMPHITLSDRVRLNMLNYLAKNRHITIQHRSMDLVEYPQLPAATTNTIWSVKSVPSVKRPRYVIVGLQTNRNGVRVRNAAQFDACTITQLRLHLNAQIYPYNMNDLDIGGGLYAELYESYTRIQASYYNNTEPTNLFNIKCNDFQDSPLFVFDTSRADESLIDSSIDIRVEIKTRENIPANTAAYCVIIYDNEFTYSPFDSIVVRKF